MQFYQTKLGLSISFRHYNITKEWNEVLFGYCFLIVTDAHFLMRKLFFVWQESFVKCAGRHHKRSKITIILFSHNELAIFFFDLFELYILVFFVQNIFSSILPLGKQKFHQALFIFGVDMNKSGLYFKQYSQ